MRASKPKGPSWSLRFEEFSFSLLDAHSFILPHHYPTTQTLTTSKTPPPAWTCLSPRAPTNSPRDSPPGGPQASPTQQIPNLPSSQITPHHEGHCHPPSCPSQELAWHPLPFPISQPRAPHIPVSTQPLMPPESALLFHPSLNTSLGPSHLASIIRTEWFFYMRI